MTIRRLTRQVTTTKGETMKNLRLKDAGSFEYTQELGEGSVEARANFALYLIRVAWNAGCDFEDLADGFGAGKGTWGGDWSGIRDSSNEATERMLERALNWVEKCCSEHKRRKDAGPYSVGRCVRP